MRTLVMWMIVAVVYLQFNSAAGGKIKKKRFCCPNKWTRYESSCYWVGYGEELTFLEAIEYCTAEGAYLVRVESADENGFLQDLLRKTKASSTWTSLNDRAHEGIWRWYGTNVHAVFSDWSPGEPNSYKGRNEDCVEFADFLNYKWNDGHCSSKRLPLCEK